MQHPRREVSVPVEAFDHLRSAVVDRAGEGADVEALHTAGFSTGTAVFDLLLGGDEDTVGDMGIAAFRTRLADFFEQRGWGSLATEDPHPGVSLLVSDDWAEAEAEERGHPTCAFTSGLLSSVLTRVAGAPVAVLETSCRARGDERCSFAFGSEVTIGRLYQGLLEGRTLDDALDHV